MGVTKVTRESSVAFKQRRWRASSLVSSPWNGLAAPVVAIPDSPGIF